MPERCKALCRSSVLICYNYVKFDDFAKHAVRSGEKKYGGKTKNTHIDQMNFL